MAANGNLNGHLNGFGDADGHVEPPVNQADNEPPIPHPNLEGVNRVAAFRQCNPPTYDGNEQGLAAQSWLHTIQTILQASELPEATWTSLAVIQLTGEAAVWWDAAGLNPWSYVWGDFATNFIAWFAPLDPPPPPPAAPIPLYDPVMALRYDNLNRTIFEWGIVEGESMLNYVERFEREILEKLPYPMDEEYKCLLFWRGVPIPVRQHTYQVQDDYYHLRTEVIYAEQVMVQQRQQEEARQRERAQVIATRGRRHFVYRGRGRSDGASTSSRPVAVRTMYNEPQVSEEDPEEDPEEGSEDDSEEDPEENPDEGSEDDSESERD